MSAPCTFVQTNRS